MLLIRCARCKRKLFKYYKIGPGEVHRCHKARMRRTYEVERAEDGLVCPCGARIGLDKGAHYAMIRQAFTYSGTKN